MRWLLPDDPYLYTPDESSKFSELMNTSVARTNDNKERIVALMVFERGVSLEDAKMALLAIGIENGLGVESIDLKRISSTARVELKIIQD